jgi:hypothetical protein
MDKLKFTETDMQDYAAGTFSGDKIAFEVFLNYDLYAKDVVSFYKTLYQGLKEEIIPAIPVDLAMTVPAIIKTRQVMENKQESWWKNISVYALSAIFLGALIFTVPRLFPANISGFLMSPYFWLGLAGLIIFICLFHFAEIRLRKTMLGRYFKFTLKPG